MQYKWLNKENNKKLIVFFNGWGMDENIVNNLDYKGFDILTFFDYRSFEMPKFDFTSYEKKYLICWSMGIYVCNLYYDMFKNFDFITAINGTQKPIDDNYGIPVIIYDLTVNNFNELSCKKFMKKISSDVDLKEYCNRSTEKLKQELISIKDLKINEYLKFSKAILSTKDRIFPYQNMYNYWNEKKVPIDSVDGFHYIFDKYNSWSDLI